MKSYFPDIKPEAHLAAFAKVAGFTVVTFDRALGKLARADVLLLK